MKTLIERLLFKTAAGRQALRDAEREELRRILAEQRKRRARRRSRGISGSSPK